MLFRSPRFVSIESTKTSWRDLRNEFDAFERRCLLEGLDDIGLTLRHADEIAAFESSQASPVDTRALA